MTGHRLFLPVPMSASFLSKVKLDRMVVTLQGQGVENTPYSERSII